MAEECVCSRWNVPPTIEYHIYEGNAPVNYYYFWSIGGVCLIISAFVVIPSISKIHDEAKKIRNKMDTALLPFAYQIVAFTVAFPLVGSTGNFIILIAPITQYIFIFVINLYIAFILFIFARLIIMYLGSYQSALKVWRSEKTSPTKYYASPPLCCFRKCISAKKMNKKDFRIIYNLIQQYMIIAPLVIFLSFFMANTLDDYYDHLAPRIIGTIQLLSSVGCLYATQALLCASKQPLNEYKIVGKFRMIQLGVMTLTVPSGIINICGFNTKINFIYDENVMNSAWSAIIGIVLYTFLSFGFKKHFTIKTAEDAMQNALLKASYVAQYQHEKKQKNNNNNITCTDQTLIDSDSQLNEEMIHLSDNQNDSKQ